MDLSNKTRAQLAQELAEAEREIKRLRAAERRRHGAEEELRKTNQLLMESRRRVVKAQETVRQVVAEQLHRQVQNRLLVACQRLRTAQEQLGHDHAELGHHLAQAASIVDAICNEDLRDLTRQLHPSMIRVGLLPSLRSLADSFGSSLDVVVECYALSPAMRSIAGTGLEQDLRLAVFRIVEEALSNVRKHAKARCVEVVVDTPSERSISVSIRDDGKGFDLDTTPTGIGILSMEDHCGAHGGDLRVESSVGQGTTVIATFPIRWQGGSPLEGQEPQPEAKAPGQPAGLTRVLVADDMQEYCQLIKETFVVSTGFDVVAEAHDGQEAVELVAKLRPDVVFLDIEMPRLSGPEAARAIKAGSSETVVFLVSAYGQEEYDSIAQAVGAHVYLAKKLLTPQRVRQELERIG